MAAPASSTPAAASALSAFLKGVERRALVVAGLQSGDEDAAGRHTPGGRRTRSGNRSAIRRLLACACSRRKHKQRVNAGRAWRFGLIHTTCG